MRKIIYLLIALMFCTAAFAQSSDYQRRYNMLLDRVGPCGVGMETLISNWSKAEPESPDMFQASFYYYLYKSQGTEIVSRRENKYLGQKPVLTLKDTTGADVHYFEVLKYDDELYAMALKSIDKAIAISPDRLDFRFLKVNAYVSYERESPDMALSNLMGLIYDFMNSKTQWFYLDAGASQPRPVDKEGFAQMMQEYCYTFYSLGTPSSLEAFLALSQRMNDHFPKSADFIGNIGSYHMVVKKDYKTALKYYDKALKLLPGEQSLISNALIAARKMGNAKLEKKYLKMREQ